MPHCAPISAVVFMASLSLPSFVYFPCSASPPCLRSPQYLFIGYLHFAHTKQLLATTCELCIRRTLIWEYNPKLMFHFQYLTLLLKRNKAVGNMNHVWWLLHHHKMYLKTRTNYSLQLQMWSTINCIYVFSFFFSLIIGLKFSSKSQKFYCSLSAGRPVTPQL